MLSDTTRTRILHEQGSPEGGGATGAICPGPRLFFWGGGRNTIKEHKITLFYFFIEKLWAALCMNVGCTYSERYYCRCFKI